MSDPKIPTDIAKRLDRGRKAMLKDAPKRRLCMRFRKGESYWHIDEKNTLVFTSTVTSLNGAGKPPHRIRNKYDFLGPIIDQKVSAATSRVPDYQINPSTPDQNRVGAAKLAEKVARFGYDQWRLRQATQKTVDLAIGGGGVGYAMPYFDPEVGPYTDVGGGQWVGRGELKVLILSGNQVYSEPGCNFEDSPWYAIERARPIDLIRQTPGFNGAELKPDASTSDIPSDRDESDNQAMVVEYFERPSSKFPEGRCMTFAANRPIVDYRLLDPTAPGPWGPYPLVDADGSVLDEPILHRLVFRHDAETDRDLGLTWVLIDFQRTIQDCWNKLLEWKNRGLNPQMIAAVGSLLDSPNDEPGAVRYYKPIGDHPPTWEQVPTGWLEPLMAIKDAAIHEMRAVAAADDFQAGSNVAARTIQAVEQQNTSQWESFLGDLAEWHSRLMRHCLLLTARHYSEPRLLAIRGRWGMPQRISDFMGAHLLGQVDVTVFPDSLASRTRQQMQQELAWIQANWPGYLTPEVAIAALHNGTAEDLIRSYDLDMGRVNGIIQAILDGTVMDLPDRLVPSPGPPDPITGQPGPTVLIPVPSYMPSEVDSVPIWKKMFGDWMKTQEFSQLAPLMQEVANQVWASLTQKEMANAIRQQQLQTAQAAGLGMANAAAPQTKGMPSQPGDGVSPSPQTGAVGAG